MHYTILSGRFCAKLSSLLIGVGWLAAMETARAQTIEVVALTGDPAPGTTSGTTFDTFLTPAINAAGQIVFPAVVEGAPVSETSNQGLWLRTGASLDLVAREGDLPPGVPVGGQYESINPAILGADGSLVFGADLRGFSSGEAFNNGVFRRSSAGAISLMMRSGQPAPGVEAGATFAAFTTPVGISSAGEVALEGVYRFDGDEFDSALYRVAADGALTMLVKRGTQTEFGNFSFGTNPFMSPQGTVIFEGLMDLNGGEAAVFETATPGEFTLIGYEGDGVPGLTGVLYGGSFADPSLTGGFKAFIARVTGPVSSNEVLMSNRTGTLAPLVRKGEPAAGFGGDVVYDDFVQQAINASGQVLFEGRVRGTGIDVSNSNAVWLADFDGIHLLLREGVPVDLGRAGVRTIQFTDLSRNSLSDTGAAAIRVAFPGNDEAILRVARATTDTIRPELKIRGAKKRTFTNRKVTLRGTATDDSATVRVEGRVRGAGKFRQAAPGSPWKLTLRLPAKNKKTVVLVRAVDANGNASAPQRIVFRQK